MIVTEGPSLAKILVHQVDSQEERFVLHLIAVVVLYPVKCELKPDHVHHVGVPSSSYIFWKPDGVVLQLRLLHPLEDRASHFFLIVKL